MTTSKGGIEFIKRFEGLRLQAYRDSAGIWTIGYGSTFYPDGIKVKAGNAITKKQADEMFLRMLTDFERKVKHRITRELKQNEFDAAVSFCYNAGTGYRDKKGKYVEYKIWENINNKDEHIKEYWETLAITAGGKVLKGLEKRRAAEVAMYLQ